MTMRPERCAADSLTSPWAGLPAASRDFRPLEAVVDGVADHVGERIGETLDHRAVDLGGFAFGAQPHDLAGRVGELAHDARHALEQRLDRLGADRHHAFLDLAGQLLERAEARGDARRARQPRLQHALRQHRLVDDQLADEIDQAIDALEIDADRRRARRASGLAASVLAFSGSAAGAAATASIGSAGADDARRSERARRRRTARSASVVGRRARPQARRRRDRRRSPARNRRRRIRTARGSPPRLRRSSARRARRDRRLRGRGRRAAAACRASHSTRNSPMRDSSRSRRTVSLPLR